jgi:hypothetical protein
MDPLATPLIPTDIDAFWDKSSLPVNLQARDALPMLVVSRQIAAGSAEEKTLQNLLAACKLGANDVEIVQVTDNDRMAWNMLRDALHPRVVLLLGVNPAQLGVVAMLREHAVSSFDEAYWIPTLSLPELNARKDVRQALWTEALSPLFAAK